MAPQPRNRLATQRLLRQAKTQGRRNLPALYLKAFGITDLTLANPPLIIDPQFKGEWSAFVSSTVNSQSSESAGRALRTVLAFLRYADSMKLDLGNEHFQFRDPITNTPKISLNNIRKALLKYDLVTRLEQVKRVLESNKIPFYFHGLKSKTTIAMDAGKPKLIAVYVMESSHNRMSLDAIFGMLKGTLYQYDLPPQLVPITKKMGTKVKDLRPPSNTMMTGAGVMGWYSLWRSPEFSVYAARARAGQLVIKVIMPQLPPNKDLGDLPLTETVKLWSKFKVL